MRQSIKHKLQARISHQGTVFLKFSSYTLPAVTSYHDIIMKNNGVFEHVRFTI